VLAAAQPGDEITLSVIRGGQELTLKLTLGELPGN
jgi:S1-C subfamily serine protease